MGKLPDEQEQALQGAAILRTKVAFGDTLPGACARRLVPGIQRLRKAIAKAGELGFLGQGILGSDFSFEIVLKEGAGAFVCGEETALMRSIEGRRGMPRPRPPFPAQSGL